MLDGEDDEGETQEGKGKKRKGEKRDDDDKMAGMAGSCPATLLPL